MCARAFCRDCGEEMIHRDHRKYYESSSGLGQIIHRDMTRAFGAADLDLAVERTRRGVTLFRTIEQKQSAHRFTGSQPQIMRVVAALINHASSCDKFTDYQLAPDSGAYVAYGEIVPASGIGEVERQRLWLPGKLTVQRLGASPESLDLSRLDFLLWLASTAEERTRYSRGDLMREFMKPEALVSYLSAHLGDGTL